MNRLKAYHGLESLKLECLHKIKMHREADTLIKGLYWEEGKGCAVGCLLESGNHMKYEERFGIPVMLARLEDLIFEGLPNELSQLWPERFLQAIKVDSDLSLVGWKFLKWLLIEQIYVKGEGKIFDDVRASLVGSANVMQMMIDEDPNAAYAAYAAADAAAADAAYAAAYAAYAAYAAAAANAANAAAGAAGAGAYAAAAGAAGADVYWIQVSDKLIELIEECN